MRSRIAATLGAAGLGLVTVAAAVAFPLPAFLAAVGVGLIIAAAAVAE